MPDKSQKYELECMRLAAECAQLAKDIDTRTPETDFLASDVHNRALQIHFLRMAKQWTARAKQRPDERFDEEIH